MRYALMGNRRVEPTPRSRGTCVCCGGVMIAKCGEKMIWHWAHLKKVECDTWWENETPWHRDWKNLFPEENQEIVCFSGGGEKHVADVKLDNGLVIEFQNSSIKKDEVKSRNDFYGNIFWVVNGLSKRQTDYSKFCNALNRSVKVNNSPMTYLVDNKHSKLIEEWSNSEKIVFFDFSEEDLDLGKVLWCLVPGQFGEGSIVMKTYLSSLLEMSSFDLSFLNKVILNLTTALKTDIERFIEKLKNEKNRKRNRIKDARYLYYF